MKTIPLIALMLAAGAALAQAPAPAKEQEKEQERKQEKKDRPLNLKLQDGGGSRMQFGPSAGEQGGGADPLPGLGAGARTLGTLPAGSASSPFPKDTNPSSR